MITQYVIIAYSYFINFLGGKTFEINFQSSAISELCTLFCSWFFVDHMFEFFVQLYISLIAFTFKNFS